MLMGNFGFLRKKAVPGQGQMFGVARNLPEIQGCYQEKVL
jgi:hypothetical protein